MAIKDYRRLYEMSKNYIKGIDEDYEYLLHKVERQRQTIENLKYDIKDQFVHISDYDKLYKENIKLKNK